MAEPANGRRAATCALSASGTTTSCLPIATGSYSRALSCLYSDCRHRSPNKPWTALQQRTVVARDFRVSTWQPPLLRHLLCTYIWPQLAFQHISINTKRQQLQPQSRIPTPCNHSAHRPKVPTDSSSSACEPLSIGPVRCFPLLPPPAVRLALMTGFPPDHWHLRPPHPPSTSETPCSQGVSALGNAGTSTAEQVCCAGTSRVSAMRPH